MRAAVSRWAALCVLGVLASQSFGADASFQGLGVLPGGDPNGHSQAMGVSADGAVVVGTSHSANGIEAFRWEGGAMTGLGDIAGGEFDSRALAVSADGSVIVGLGTWGTSQDSWQRAVCWENGVMSALGVEYSYATAVSADGSAIALNGISGLSQSTSAHLWQGGVVTPLGTLGDPWVSTEVRGISADGTVAVGASGSLAFRWEAGQMVALDGLSGPKPAATAAGASFDGSVIVGQATGGVGMLPMVVDILAVRWDEGVISSLGYTCPVGSSSWHVGEALAVSASGSFVVGRSVCLVVTTSSPWTSPGTSRLFVEEPSSGGSSIEEYTPLGEAFVWTPQAGMQDLRDVLTDMGVDVSAWEYLTAATSVSADGSTIAGYGINANGMSEAWVATLPPRLDVRVDRPDLGTVQIDPNLAWYTDPNTEVTLTAIPDAGKGAIFTGWLIFDPDHPGDVSYATADANETVTVVMDRYRELQASFYADRALTVRWWRDDMIDLDPPPADANEPRYEYGTAVTLTAVPSCDRLRFRKWYVFDPNFPGDVNHATIEPNDSLNLVMDVDWEVQPYYVMHYDIPDDCGDGAALTLPLALGVLGVFFVRRRGA